MIALSLLRNGVRKRVVHVQAQQLLETHSKQDQNLPHQNYLLSDQD